MNLKRTLALLLAVLMLVGVLAACNNTPAETTAPAGNETTKPAGNETTAPPVEEGGLKQSPMLDDKGLAPVEERLPAEYVTVTPKNEVGVYGGTYYGAFPTAYEGQAWQTLGFFEPMIGWNEDQTALIPNVLADFSFNEDATVYTLKLREGLKWSDGEPVTTEDIRYLVEDVWGNPALYTSFPTNYMAGGEPLKLEVIDEYNCTLTFAAPNPTFPYIINQAGNTMIIPSHYMKQFNNLHEKEENLVKMATEQGFDNWTAMYNEKGSWYANPDYPTLHAWHLTSVSEDGLHFQCERNPYYFKVDTAGNQLPYMDYCQVEYVDNAETLNLKVMAGEVDYINAPVGEGLVNYPLFAENAAAGNYRVILASDDFAHKFQILPNHASQDPQKGPLLSNKNFRIALSYAINREEAVTLFGSVGDIKAEIAQQSPVKASPYYHEELANQYIEYNPDEANKLLDELGLTKRDANGYRLGLDGKEMVFQFTIATYDDSWIDIGTLVSDYWKAVGLNVEVKAIDPTLWNELNSSNTYEITGLSSGSGGMVMATTQHINAYGLSTTGWDQRWATAWGQWWKTNGAEGIEPPQEVKELNELQQIALQTADPEELKVAIKNLLDKRAEIFPTINVMRTMPQFCVVHNDIKNGPDEKEPFVTFAFGVGGNVNPCQFYKEQ